MDKRHVSSAVLLALALAAGCGTQEGGVSRPPATGAKAPTKGEHDHGPGPHGGTIIEFGKLHAEFTVDHAKQEATVYVLSGDLKRAVPIPTDKLLLSIKTPPFQTDLKAVPLDGEPAGQSSRFVGRHTALGKEQEFEGTVSGEWNGTPYLGDFKEKPEGHEKDKK
jgi:hypothetical protein